MITHYVVGMTKDDTIKYGFSSSNVLMSKGYAGPGCLKLNIAKYTKYHNVFDALAVARRLNIYYTLNTRGPFCVAACEHANILGLVTRTDATVVYNELMSRDGKENTTQAV